VSSQANTLTFDNITKKNGDEKERRDENERQHGPLRLQTKSILVVHPVTSDHHVADELFWCCRLALVLCSSNRLKLSRSSVSLLPHPWWIAM
jgi:hypothetical protein